MRGQIFLNVSFEEAEPLVAALLFPGRPFVSERIGRGVELSFVVGASTKVTSFKTGLLDGDIMVRNLLGLASLVVIGRATFYARPDASTGRDQHRVLVEIYPSGQGVKLGIRTQHNADTPKAPKDELLQGLADQINQQKDVICAYFSVRALFGQLVRGSTAFVLTPKAIERRIRIVGGPLTKHSQSLAVRLCPREAM